MNITLINEALRTESEQHNHRAAGDGYAITENTFNFTYFQTSI
jgi:hypothetical protein